MLGAGKYLWSDLHIRMWTPGWERPPGRLVVRPWASEPSVRSGLLVRKPLRRSCKGLVPWPPALWTQASKPSREPRSFQAGWLHLSLYEQMLTGTPMVKDKAGEMIVVTISGQSPLVTACPVGLPNPLSPRHSAVFQAETSDGRPAGANTAEPQVPKASGRACGCRPSCRARARCGSWEGQGPTLSPAVPQAMVLTLRAWREEVVMCYQGTPPCCGEGTAQESGWILPPALEASTTEMGACCVGRPLPPAVMVVQVLGWKAGLLRVAAT